jgi:hypothetical protein
MKSVFLLLHVRQDGPDDEDIKAIGIYTTKEKAEKTIEKFKKLPGFKDYPDSFYIPEFELDKDHWTEGFGV